MELVHPLEPLERDAADEHIAERQPRRIWSSSPAFNGADVNAWSALAQ
jgi:hypothetical protein